MSDYRIGIIEWFDGDEGYIRDAETGTSYYVHISAMDKVPALASKYMYRKLPVLFTIYTNLYMSQVDKVKLIDKLSEMPQDLVNQSNGTYQIAWNLLCEQLGSINHKVFIE